MARPRKNRIVGAIPGSEGFVPLGCSQGQCCAKVIMTVEEYETLRLIDYLNLTQEACAARMEVSRSTVTGIYERARFKIADALVNEKLLLIEGGSFDFSREHKKTACIEKENTIMKIAVTYDNGQIFQHFGHCQNFKIYQVEDGKILSSQIIDAAGSGHGALGRLSSGRRSGNAHLRRYRRRRADGSGADRHPPLCRHLRRCGRCRRRAAGRNPSVQRRSHLRASRPWRRPFLATAMAEATAAAAANAANRLLSGLFRGPFN